jgi:hypothetical protein
MRVCYQGMRFLESIGVDVAEDVDYTSYNEYRK